MMAEGTPADNKRRDDNQKQHDKISNQCIYIINGKAVFRLIKEIYFSVSSAFECYNHNGTNPGCPDNPFDKVASFSFPCSCEQYRLLTAACGTHPSAETSAEKQRAYKQQQKNDKATVYNSFAGRFDYQVRGKIIKRSGKKKERKQYNSESYVLSVIHPGAFPFE